MSKKALANQLLAKVKRESAAVGQDLTEQKVQAIRARLFDKQVAYIDDPSDRKAMLCPRRSGKSAAIVFDIALTGETVPNARMLVIGITRNNARRLCWEELKILNDALGLGIYFNNHRQEATFPKGGKLYLGGADSRHEIEKYRGGYYHKVWIDEAASYPPGLLKELCEQVIEPALLDYRGTLTLAGTPGKILDGFFYDITKSDSEISRPFNGQPVVRQRGVKGPSWSFHKWSSSDNKAMPHIWEEALLMKESAGMPDDDPRWRREYLGEWVGDDANFAFRYNPERDSWRQDIDAQNFGLSLDHEWKFVLGIDLGYDDDTAFVVLAYSDTHPHCFEVHAHSEDQLAPHQVVQQIRDLQERFGEFEAIVGDRAGQAKMLFAGFAEEGIAIIPADKHHKRDHVELINSDFMSSKLKVRHDSPLVFGLHFIEWNKSGNNFEKRSAPTHLADAFLYVWRYCYHHFFENRSRPALKGTKEWIDQKLKDEERLVEERLIARQDMDYWESEFSSGDTEWLN